MKQEMRRSVEVRMVKFYAYLHHEIDFGVQTIQEALFGRERPYRDNAFQYLREVREDGRPCVGFHAS